MKGKGRQDSDGTPSMGSSFSDLDGMLAVLFLWMLYMYELTRYRCISNAECVGGGAGEQYASWRRDGKPNELHQPGSPEQVFMNVEMILLFGVLYRWR